SALDQLNTPAGQPARQFLLDLRAVGAEFPFLYRPTSVFHILTGKEVVDLFTFQVPSVGLTGRLVRDFGPLFPFPPLYVAVDLSVGFQINLRFGYDTYGLRQFLLTQDPAQLIDGLFVDVNASNLRLTASAGLRASIGIPFVRVGVGGRIVADVNFTLFDPDRDGKARALEIQQNIASGCFFNRSGGLFAQLYAFVTLGIWPFEWTKEFHLASKRLLDFSYACPPPPPPPQLARVENGTLYVHMGPDAARRVTVNTVDGDETFSIVHVSNELDGTETVRVNAFGYSREYAGVRPIVADAG